MGVKRKILAGLVVLGVAPGTFVRSDLPPPDFTSPVAIQRLDTRPLKSGPLELEDAWVLTSKNDHFGGFSALIAWKPDQFLAANDAGRLMHLPRPDRSSAAPTLDRFLNFERVDKTHVDIESLTFDPATGEVWAGLEWAQQIIRFGPRLQHRGQVRPPEMMEWGGNSGPESMLRLKDGRFIVIEERASAEGLHEALLFPGDPTDDEEPMRFVFQARDGYRPSDAALLPNGRIVVLLRGVELGLPLSFPALLVVADPRDIAEDSVLRSRFLAKIEEPFPSDNFEGLTVVDEKDGSWSLWLISDDNFASYQRTLLLKLRWDRTAAQARQKARR